MGDVPMTECQPCREQDIRGSVAHRMVPIKGRGVVPMCDICWGGGHGPGFEPRKVEVSFDYGEPPAAKEKVMAQCQCSPGCVKEAKEGKKFAWGHGGKAKLKLNGHRQLTVRPTGQFAGAIAELTAQRDKIDRAIEVLQGL